MDELQKETNELKINNSTDQQEGGGNTATYNGIKSVVSEENEDTPKRKNITLREVLGGDLLTRDILLRQKWLILEIVMFCIIYITLRYSVQTDAVKINKLEKKYEIVKNKATTYSAEITEQSRQSRVESTLRENGDSTLSIAITPPIVINYTDDEYSND